MPDALATLIAAVLEIDCATACYRDVRSERCRRLREAVAGLRLAVAPAALMGLDFREPRAAFVRAVDLAVDAGLTWHDLAAVVNRAGEARPTGGRVA